MLVISYLVSVHKEKQVSSGNSRQWIKTTLDIGWLRILILWSGLEKMPHSDQGVLVKSSSFRKLLGEYREKGQLLGAGDVGYHLSSCSVCLFTWGHTACHLQWGLCLPSHHLAQLLQTWPSHTSQSVGLLTDPHPLPLGDGALRL